MATTLANYILQCRRLLHDANGNFYSDSELTDYINEARSRLVRDTGCLRRIQLFATTTNREQYDFAELPEGAQTMDLLNINLYWGNTRIPLRYLAWTNFNAQLRYWQNYTGTPIAFSMYGTQTFYLGPIPDQIYEVELDTVLEPAPLVNGTDVDPIADPWTSPVPYYASSVAKFKEQSYGESEIFKNEYIKKTQNVLAQTYTRRLPTPYSQG